MPGLSTSLSALNAFSVGVQGTAYNIANVSTDGFRPVSVRYRSGRPADFGVEPVITRPRPMPDELVGRTPGPLPFSRTDVAREMTHLMVNQRSFEANAAVVRSVDEMLGVLVDLRV
ncbi:MAG: flagellar biosynthesis protein FlgG [Desulfovibrio sp.]|jgi:flagellar basal-body rod protein FlgC|nr:flagellar biosynthesis protein FlgG [Desulfovibrio sp.]